jgi:arabinogalactan endo-1,4-beta-galactosidase
VADVPTPEFQIYWTQELLSLKSECHAITNKYPKAASVVQQGRKILSDIEKPDRHQLKWGKSSEWSSIVNSAEENRANICKNLDRKPLFSALYGMYTVTLNELKVVLKVSAQTAQSGVVNETSDESTAEDDDFQEVKKCKRDNSIDTPQSAKKSTKRIRTSAAVKLPPKAVSTRNFVSLRTTDMDTEPAGAENALPEQETPRKSGRSPIVMTSTTNLIQL